MGSRGYGESTVPLQPCGFWLVFPLTADTRCQEVAHLFWAFRSGVRASGWGRQDSDSARCVRGKTLSWLCVVTVINKGTFPSSCDAPGVHVLIYRTDLTMKQGCFVPQFSCCKATIGWLPWFHQYLPRYWLLPRDLLSFSALGVFSSSPLPLLPLGFWL